jgi:hypothetical protein
MKNSETTFLNVDLDMSAKSDLQPLVSALGRRVIPLYVGRDRRRYVAHLELANQPKNPDQAIREFDCLIHSLPKKLQSLWASAKVLDFNVGVQAADTPHSYALPFSRETIEAVSALRGRIVLTIYAPYRSSRKSAPPPQTTQLSPAGMNKRSV